MDKLKNWIQENSHKMDFDEPNAAAWDRLKRTLSTQKEDDPLKHHLAENKNELEVEAPDIQSWKRIHNSIKDKKSAQVRHIKKRMFYYLSAACILVIVGLGVFRYINDVRVTEAQDVVNKPALKNKVAATDTTEIDSNKSQLTSAPSLPDQPLKQNIKYKSIAVASSKPIKKQKIDSLPLEVLQIEKDYDQLIAGQIAYTKSLAVYGESASYFQEFMNDFKMLEAQEKELRQLIVQNGLQENSIDELAMIYQQKLTVLKKLQNEINKTSKCNKDLTDTIPAYISL